jgi:hypothetical protein
MVRLDTIGLFVRPDRIEHNVALDYLSEQSAERLN